MGCWGPKGQLGEACGPHQIPIREGTSNQYGMLTRWAEHYKPICCFGSDLCLEQIQKKKKKAFPIIKSFPKTSPKFLYFFCLWSMLRFVCGLQTSTETVITLSPVDRLADKEYNKKYNLFMSHVKSWARRLIRKDWPLCCFANRVLPSTAFIWPSHLGNHLFITHHLGIFLDTCWVGSRQLITRGFITIKLFQVEYSSLITGVICLMSALQRWWKAHACGSQECFVGEQVESELAHHTQSIHMNIVKSLKPYSTYTLSACFHPKSLDPAYKLIRSPVLFWIPIYIQFMDIWK